MHYVGILFHHNSFKNIDGEIDCLKLCPAFKYSGGFGKIT